MLNLKVKWSYMNSIRLIIKCVVCVMCLSTVLVFKAMELEVSTRKLLEAAKIGNAERIQQLIRGKADVNGYYKDRAAVHLAAEGCHVDSLKILLDAGAAIDVVDHGGFTPLNCASLADDFDGVYLLLERGADRDIANYEGLTPLQLADEWGREKVLPLLEHWTHYCNYREVLKARWTAFCMGSYDRWGQDSLVRKLPAEISQHICSYVRYSTTFNEFFRTQVLPAQQEARQQGVTRSPSKRPREDSPRSDLFRDSDDQKDRDNSQQKKAREH